MEEQDSNHKEPSTEVVVLGDVPVITDAELPPPPITEKKEEVIKEEVKEKNVPGQDSNTTTEQEETKEEGGEGDDDMIPTSAISPKRMSTVAKGLHAAMKLNQGGGSGDIEKCPLCSKSVFRVERVICGVNSWHKSCFVCGGTGDLGCKRILSRDFNIHQNMPYCRTCYSKALGNNVGIPSEATSESMDEVPGPIVASSSGVARAEMPSLLAGVRVAERASHFASRSTPNKTGSESSTSKIAVVSNKCARCDKSVYKAEETRAVGQLWHKSCFTCGARSESTAGCGRVLARDNFLQHGGVAFCKACFPVFSKDPNFRGVPLVSKGLGVAAPRVWKTPGNSTPRGEASKEEEHTHGDADTRQQLEEGSEADGGNEGEGEGEGEAAEEFNDEEEDQQEDEALNADEQIQIQLERELEEGGDSAATQAESEPEEDEKEDNVITKVQGGPQEWEPEQDGERSVLDDQKVAPPTSSKRNGVEVLTTVLTGFTAPFDKNGVLYHIATRGQTEPYQNPHLSGAVCASMSSIYKGYVHHVVEQKRSLMPNYSNNTKRSWVAVDLGKGRRLVPTRYCIRHGASGRGNALRTWELRAREHDTDGWTVLRAHYNDDAISELPYSAAAWKLRPPKVSDEKAAADKDKAGLPPTGYRYFLILQMGLNSSNNDCFFIGGMELYGTLTEEEGLDDVA